MSEHVSMAAEQRSTPAA